MKQLDSKLHERAQFQNQFNPDSSVPKTQTVSSGRKQEKIVRTYEEPVLPKLAKILFISMLVLTTAILAVDAKNGISYIEQLGLLQIFQNISLSALISWSIFAVLLFIVCLLGMRQNRIVVQRRMPVCEDQSFSKEDLAQFVRAVKRLNKPYRFYLLFAVIGFILWVLFFLTVHCCL